MNNDYNNSTLINQDFSMKMNDEIADGGIAADSAPLELLFVNWLRLKQTQRRMHCLTLSPKALFSTCLQNKSSENTVGKGKIALNEQFLLSPQCF